MISLKENTKPKNQSIKLKPPKKQRKKSNSKEKSRNQLKKVNRSLKKKIRKSLRLQSKRIEMGDGGTQYAQVLQKPMLAGSKVKIIDVVQEGAWYKVELPGGLTGFVQVEQLRII